MDFQAVRRGEDTVAHNDRARRGVVPRAPPHGDHHGRLRLRLQQLALGRPKPGIPSSPINDLKGKNRIL